MDHEKIIKLLQYPEKKVRVVIDTDAYNEVDDQFAIAWALRSTERMEVEAVYAAPFCSRALLEIGSLPEEMTEQAIKGIESMAHYAATPAEGMESSYEEILKLFALMGKDPSDKVFRGSTRYIGEDKQPVDSEAARDLISRAMSGKEPLYVLAIGEITNVASALLMEPRIADKIVVVWLGGQPLHFKSAIEFNLMQDLTASKLMFDSGIPLVLIPCMTVASHLTVTKEELEGRLIGKSEVGSYLGKSVISMFHDGAIPQSDKLLKGSYLRGMDDVPEKIANQFCTKSISWSRIIWDISAVGYLINPNWCATTLVPSPILTDDLRWEFDKNRHPIRVCNYVSRDQIFGDMFEKLGK